MSARRRARETPVSSLPEGAGRPAEQPDADALRMIDEELAGLPDHLRVAVVLCELDGVGRAEAAARLGIRPGTLSSRLARARKALAERLRKRGVAAPAAGFALLGTVAVPSRLVARTSALATSTGRLPAAVAALSNGVIRAMFLQKLKLAAGALLLAVACVATLPLVSAQTPAKPRPAALALAQTAADEKKPAPAAKPAGPGKLLVMIDGRLLQYDPDGTGEKELATKVMAAAMSPDGKWLALTVMTGYKDERATYRPFLRPLGEKEKADDLPLGDEQPFPVSISFVWAPDSARVVVKTTTYDLTANPPTTTDVEAVYDLATRKSAALKLPEGHMVGGWSRDGKRFLTTSDTGWNPKAAPRLAWVPVDGGEPEFLTPDKKAAIGGKVSPDGTRVLYVEIDPDNKTPGAYQLSVLNLKDKTTTRVSEAQNGLVQGYAWSPDGKRIAYDWQMMFEKPEDAAGKDREGFVVVCDADGKNQKTVLTHKLGNTTTGGPGGMVLFDWR
jgi:hypothetical protein